MHSPRVSDALASRLHAEAGAARWGLPVGAYRAALDRSVSHAFADRAASTDQVERYLAALHLEDLALAEACRAGLASAWDHFVGQFRPALYRAADAIDPTGAARELADALYGELFGLDARDGERRSLFRYFHGRSSLATWLRAVLAQRFVDHTRATRRLEPLAEDADDTRPAAATDPDRPRLFAALAAALGDALAALAPRDRLRLACYYAHGVTLAAIGRTLGEHEATVSRQLARTRRQLREDVERRLRDGHGMDASTITECWHAALDDAGPIDVAAMVGDGASRKNVPPARSKDSESDEDRDKERM